MQKIFVRTAVGAVAAVLAGAPALAQEPDYESVAQKVVTESAGVQPGEVVVLSGSPSELDILTALTAAVLEAGGLPITTIDLPQAYRKAVMAADIAYLRQEPKAQLALIDAADVFINASAVSAPGLFADVPEERFAALRENNGMVAAALKEKAPRSVDLGQSGGIPTKAYADSLGTDYQEMRAMFWSALDVPAEEVAATGETVSAKMSGGSTVTVASDAGTNLTFELSDEPSRVSTGRAADNAGEGGAQAFLPAGDFYACAAPGSASGVIVAPYVDFRGEPVRDLRLTVKNGAVTGVKAKENQKAVKAFMDTLDEAGKTVSLVNIGLNPESRMLDGSEYRSWEMAGMVTLYLGTNQWAGCGHAADSGFPLHIDGATVKAGDATVVADGSLAD